MKQNQSRLIKLLFTLIAIFALFLIKDELPKYLPEKSGRVFSDLKKEKIHLIKITQTKTSQIYKKNNNWFINIDNTEFRADKERIKKIIEAFVNLRKDNIVSTNKSKHKDLGIDKQKIELRTDEKNYILYIGDSASFTNNYLRVGNEDEVFLTEGFNEIFIDEDFRDLKVPVVSNETKVTNIEINYQGISTLLSKKGRDWKIGDKNAEQDRVNFYLNDLKTLKANNILKKKENYSAVMPELSIRLNEKGKEKIIAFYPENAESYLATITSINYDYIIPTAYVASLKKEAKDFLD